MKIGWGRDEAPQKVFMTPVLAGAGTEVRMGHVGKSCGEAPHVGRPLSQGLQSRDDGWLFAMCMFCIFSRFAALAAGAAGKKACPAVCSASPDSDE